MSPTKNDRGPVGRAPADGPAVEGQQQAPPFFGILVVAGLVVVGVGLKSTASIVAPVFLVITLVITVSPVRRFLVRRKVPSPLASVVALLAIYLLLIVILGSVVWSLYKLVEQLPDYANAFTKIYSSALSLANQVGFGQTQLQQLFSSLSLTSLAGPAQTVLNTLTSGASLLVLIVAVAIFLSFDQAGIPAKLETISRSRPQIARGLQSFADRVRKYWVVTTVFGLIVAVLDYVGLLIIGVPLAFTWGVLAFVTNYIPNVGFVIGVIPPALIALLDGGLGSAIAVVVVYCGLNVVVQTIIQPRFTGDAVGISSTVAFVSLIFWAYLLGALGALIAIPATLFLKSVLLDNTQPESWLGVLISSESSGARPKPRTFRKKQRRASATG